MTVESAATREAAGALRWWREAGAELGRGHRQTQRRARPARRPDRRRQVRDLAARAAADPSREHAAWVLDGFRLLLSAAKDARDFACRLCAFRPVIDPSGVALPRVVALARAYLDASGGAFEESELVAFLDAYQETAPLDMRDLWALKPALESELIGRLAGAEAGQWPALMTALRRLTEVYWREFLETVSHTHRALARDPARAYSRMDAATRNLYAGVIAELADRSPRPEREIAETAIALAQEACRTSDGSRAAARRTHVGFYLVDRGRARLEAAIGYRPSLAARIPRFILRHPTEFYLGGIEMLTLFIVFWVFHQLDPAKPALAALLLLALPATQAAVDFLNNLAAFLVPPRVLPKLDFSEGIPGDCATLVAVPTLLLNEAQAHDLVLDLEIRFLANRGPNLYFALLTDGPDSGHPDRGDEPLVDLCRRLIEGLNQRYRGTGAAPFFLFHRHRAYNHAEGCWMGWERKRGKLLDLNQLLRGGFDAFPVKVGDLSALPGIRYVITLDADTQLPRDAAAQLIGALAHPLNQAVVDPARRLVVEGYGIVQPRIGIDVQSASRSRLAALYSGQTGFDIYTRAVSDVYQDLFGEGIFAGKGIYEVDTLREVLEGRFPEDALLSHDLIEGAYARAALASDIELIDGYPSHFSAYSRRKHRWLRGDWQIVRWVLSRVPDARGRIVQNPITLLSQWKILDNLRRSLLEPSLVVLLVSGWLWLPGRPAYWTAATLLMGSIPVLSSLLFSLLRLPGRRRARAGALAESARGFRDNVLVAACNLVFLLHQALISMDAIVRAVSRVLVTKKKLLEWETAAEAEAATRPKATVDLYLKWTPWLALAFTAGLWIGRPAALPSALPLLTLWALSRGFSNWLNRRPRARHSELRKEQVLLLRESADRIWRFFHDWSSASTNWLIPDSVRENGGVELRLSPTNLAMLLNARIAALHLGAMPLAEFVFETRQTLERVARLPKHRGHLLNWYDINSLEPLTPRFVSTVDSGNLAAGLWTLKQAASALAAESAVKRGLTRELAVELLAIADQCDRLVREMDFRFLYRRRNKALSIGYDLDAGQLDPASYDLLASEARTAAFVAIAKGDIPKEAWLRLGRAHTVFSGERVLLSWTGTMFEYLMPLLWMRHPSGTLLERSTKAALHSQREYARRRGVPWGISESAFLSGPDREFGYAPFGVPELAIHRSRSQPLVISPYSSFLAAGVDPLAAAENLRQMQEYGWLGRYGFYESIAYTRHGAQAVRQWMAHHQGMSLLAIVNLLFDNPLRRYFHAEPQVLATELLLYERMPPALQVDEDAPPVPEAEPLAA
jgi:cyclic beta-1,2-glucan synthetase